MSGATPQGAAGGQPNASYGAHAQSGGASGGLATGGTPTGTVAAGGGGPATAGAGSVGGGGTGASTTAPAAPSAQNLNQIPTHRYTMNHTASKSVDARDEYERTTVTDYLLKRGFTQTERIFRQESSDLGPDGRPRNHAVSQSGPKKYTKSMSLLKNWVESNLDIYKPDLNRVLWPIFVYSFLDLVQEGYTDEAKGFLASFRSRFEAVHGDELKTFSTISLPQHLRENTTTALYMDNKYRLPLPTEIASLLFNFLARETFNGGEVIAGLINERCDLKPPAHGPVEPFSFDTILRRAQNIDMNEAGVQEGIPGVFTGINNRDVLDTTTPLRLGPLPMEQDLRDDVRAELVEEDQKNPPIDGRSSLADEFDRKIKREESADAPPRADLPLPPSRARDVVMEMQKIREYRDRFHIEGRTGGVGVPVSSCMFTFHNTLGSVSCMDFSRDHQLVAAGTMDSYIRVWSLDGTALQSKLPNEKDLKVNNRKLIGHSGPVYGVSFSDSISNLNRNLYGEDGQNQVETNSKLLLSCSADGQIRLWSLDVWSCLCIYKAHDGPIFRVLWGPHGHYFATAGWDKTVRVFMQDHASAQRIMVGHDTSISALAWHPNGTYVFSASDETDKSIRMWSVVTGACVRVFTGHTDYISTLECAPNGKILASADNGGNIFLWDINKGSRIKRCRGHGKGGIPSLSFSAESNVLVSGGLDGTVRLWDVELPADPARANPLLFNAASAVHPGQQPDGGTSTGDGTTPAGQADGRSITVGGGQGPPPVSSTNNAGAGVAGSSSKKKSKDVQITPDQISAFPTKKTPVMKVQFTRMNLVIAGGCYDPER